jgi:CubicO group peptidase (beta-lactamase class C family)
MTSTRQPGEGPRRAAPEIDQQDMKARVNEIVNRRPAVGLAVGVVRHGRLEFFHGHGRADIASDTPVTEDTVFRIGSITKTITAIAIVQLWEQGLVDLDAPASDYLRAYRLIPAKAGFRPATIRHLLTHTAGLRETMHPFGLVSPLYGELVRVGRRVPSLAEYYRGGLRLVAEPGTGFIYSNHGFDTLGQIVEDVTRVPLDRYLREHVFDPLGMAHTDLVRSDRVRSRLATGYRLRSGGPRAVADYELVTAQAGAVYSTTRDMARYVAALLGGGANEHGSILKPATMAAMFEAHYQPDPRIPGIGLAFFRYRRGSRLVVEHGGILPGFHSQMFLAPDDGVGVLAFTNGGRGAMWWLPAEASGLLGQLLAVPDEVVRTDVPQHPEIWPTICGRYQLSAPLTDGPVRAIMGLGAEVVIRRGRLTLRALSPIPSLYRGFPLHPDDPGDPYVFRIDLSQYGIGTARVVFSRGPDGMATRLNIDVNCLSLGRQPPIKNRRLAVTGALGVLAVATAARAVRRARGGRCGKT